MRNLTHDDVIRWKHFPRYLHFVRGIHRSPMNSQRKHQWRGAFQLMFSWICTRNNSWVNNGDAGDLRRYRAHYNVIVMFTKLTKWQYYGNGSHWKSWLNFVTSYFSTNTPHVSESWFPWQNGGRRDLRERSRRRHGGYWKLATDGTFEGKCFVRRSSSISRLFVQ